MTSLVIRHAVAADAPAIAHVHVESQRSAYRGILPETYLAALSEADRRSLWERVLGRVRNRDFVVVAEHEARIVAFVHGGPERSGDLEFTGEIYALYLLAEHRGLGIGTQLFRGAAALLRDAGMFRMKLLALRDNAFRRFYDKHGGREIGVQSVVIAGQEFPEIVYQWDDLSRFPRAEEILRRDQDP
jgi:GNAT superfamily N-acetyltransferase